MPIVSQVSDVANVPLVKIMIIFSHKTVSMCFLINKFIVIT